MARLLLRLTTVAAALVSALGLCDPRRVQLGWDNATMPRPFSRELQRGMSGTDVYILQNLLQRLVPSLPATGFFGDETDSALQVFEASHSLPLDGVLDSLTACEVLAELSADGYRDDGAPARSLGYLYKIHVPVFSNRSIETVATLLDADNTPLLTFTVRTHGMDSTQTVPGAWPYFNNLDPGLNQFSDGGATPTGLSAVDLNTPESNATEFGPYPINRFVVGLRGNARWLMTNDAGTMVRDGILLHTGNWSEVGWAPPASMPNSLGCVHAWPQNIHAVWSILTSALGVQARPNTDGALPYPYKPQGLISVEQLD